MLFTVLWNELNDAGGVGIAKGLGNLINLQFLTFNIRDTNIGNMAGIEFGNSIGNLSLLTYLWFSMS